MNKKQLKAARKLMNKTRYRSVDVQIKALHDPEEDEKGRISFSASSNEPVETFIWTDDFMGRALEVLSHKEGDMDLSRLENGIGHFIMNHNASEKNTNLGIIENASVDGKRLNVDVKFNPFNPQAERVENEMKSGFRSNISIGFRRFDDTMKLIGHDEERNLPIFQFNSAIHEISSVLLPADTTIGVGRSDEELLMRELGLDNNDTEHKTLVSDLLKEMKGSVEEIEDNSNESLLIVETKSAGDSTTDSDSLEEQEMSEKKQDESTVVDATAGADLDAARASAAEVMDLLMTNGQESLAVEATRDGWTLDHARARLFEAQKTDRQVETASPMEAGQKEQRELNLNAAFRNYVQDVGGSPVNDLGREVARACGMTVRPDAMYIPINRQLGLRALSTSPAAQGGDLVGTDFRPLAESLFEETIAAQVGVKFEQVSSDQQIPRWGNNNVAAWVAEDSAIGLTSGSVSSVTATPNQLVSHVPITPFLGVAVAGAYDPLNATLDNMVESLKDQAELSVWDGTGTEQPTGILNTGTISSITSGSNADNELYGRLWEDVRDNAHRGAGPFVVSSDVYRAGVDNPALTSGSDRATITVSGGVASTDYGKVIDSQHLPALSALFGSFNAVLAANFGVIEIRRDQSMQAANGRDVLIARLFFDVVVQNPGKLSKSDGEVDLTP